MSMYNLMFGPTEHKRPIALLANVDPDKIGRFRDLWVEQPVKGMYVLAIYTRTGGNNRAEYEDWIEYARAQPNFISDQDDTFDTTYAVFRFQITEAGMRRYLEWASDQGWEDDSQPVTVDDMRAVLADAGDEINTDERWQEAFRGMSEAEGT